MKPRSRYRLLAVLGLVGGLLSFAAWRGVTQEDPNNQGGVLLGLIGLLVVACVYGATGLHFIRDRFRRARSKRPPSSANSDFDRQT